MTTDLEYVLQGHSNLVPSSKLLSLQNVHEGRMHISHNQTDVYNDVHTPRGLGNSQRPPIPFLPTEHTPEDHCGRLSETEAGVDVERVLQKVFHTAGRLTKRIITSDSEGILLLSFRIQLPPKTKATTIL